MVKRETSICFIIERIYSSSSMTNIFAMFTLLIRLVQNPPDFLSVFQDIKVPAEILVGRSDIINCLVIPARHLYRKDSPENLAWECLEQRNELLSLIARSQIGDSFLAICIFNSLIFFSWQSINSNYNDMESPNRRIMWSKIRRNHFLGSSRNLLLLGYSYPLSCL